MSDDQARADYIAGLRRLADLLDGNSDLPLPFEGSETAELGIFTRTREETVAWARAIGRAEKQVDDSDSYYGFRLKGMIGGLHVLIHGRRSEVCTRRVIATREVTEEVPDPDAPLITVTKTVEDIAWDCHPLLSDVTS